MRTILFAALVTLVVVVAAVLLLRRRKSQPAVDVERFHRTRSMTTEWAERYSGAPPDLPRPPRATVTGAPLPEPSDDSDPQR